MAPFGQNFKGGQSMIICPFCRNHVDGQEESWGCKPINRIIDIQCEYKEIFGQKFSENIVKTVEQAGAELCQAQLELATC